MIHRLGPTPETVDVLELYMGDDRGRRDRPWIMFNMVSSVDGATALDGGSSALNDADDKTVFRALRTVADVILVGAGTVRAEDYGPVRLDSERRALRLRRGHTETPLLGIVSGRLNLDPEARVFSDPEHRPLVLTGAEADPAKLALLGDAAEIVFLPELTPAAIVGHLGAASVILSEGGPSLNGQFVAAGLVDEMNVTVSPLLASGHSHRIAHGDVADPPLEMTLDRTLIGDRSLFLRYLRADSREGI